MQTPITRARPRQRGRPFAMKQVLGSAAPQRAGTTAIGDAITTGGGLATEQPVIRV